MLSFLWGRGGLCLQDALLVFHAKTGTLVHKMPLKYPSFKDFHLVIPLPNKPTQVALIDQDKGNIVDIRSKKFVRSIPKWGGKVSLPSVTRSLFSFTVYRFLTSFEKCI